MAKAKKNTPRRDLARYLLLWIGSYIGGWLLGLTMYNGFTWVFNGLPLANSLLIALAPGLLITLGQLALVARRLGIAYRTWLIVSMMGWLLGGLAHVTIVDLDASPGVQVALIAIIAAVAQWPLLTRRVGSAWLWPLASLIGALAFGAALVTSYTSSNEWLMLSLGGLMQGGVTGLAMWHLLGQRLGDDRKRKAESGAQSAEARPAFSRLSDDLPPGSAAMPLTNEDAALHQPPLGHR